MHRQRSLGKAKAGNSQAVSAFKWIIIILVSLTSHLVLLLVITINRYRLFLLIKDDGFR